MINTYTKTFEILDNDRMNRIDCKVYYYLGGTNFFYGNVEQRGYYFSIRPYEIIDHGNGLYSRCLHISPTAGSGIKTCILPVNRQSKKRYEEAKGKIDELIERFLEPYCEENGLRLGQLVNVTEEER